VAANENKVEEKAEKELEEKIKICKSRTEIEKELNPHTTSPTK
jgi:hypothetical protein